MPRIITPSSTAWPPIGASLVASRRRSGARRCRRGRAHLAHGIGGRAASLRVRSATRQVGAGELRARCRPPSDSTIRPSGSAARLDAGRGRRGRGTSASATLAGAERATAHGVDRRAVHRQPHRHAARPAPLPLLVTSTGSATRPALRRAPTPASCTRRFGSALELAAGAPSALARPAARSPVRRRTSGSRPGPGRRASAQVRARACGSRSRRRRLRPAPAPEARAPYRAEARRALALEQREAHRHALGVRRLGACSPPNAAVVRATRAGDSRELHRAARAARAAAGAAAERQRRGRASAADRERADACLVRTGRKAASCAAAASRGCGARRGGGSAPRGRRCPPASAARVERVAVRADLDVELGLGGAGPELVAAGAAHVGRHVLGMDLRASWLLRV